MDKTKTKLAAFFDNDEEESSFPQKTVDDAKLSQYAAGKVRKSRREKEQEAAEAKKREEEADAAKAYAEFIDAFEGEGVGRRREGTGFVKSSSEAKVAYTHNDKSSVDQPRVGVRLNRSPSPSPNAAPKPKGKRAMDQFLEEIKKDQAEREAKFSRHAHGHGRSVTAMAAYEGQSGSKDRGDPQTSNVFVANLPSHVTEQALGTFFARVGPVGSVKVMWPRGDASSGPGADMTASRRNKSAGLSGFVSFMKRKDAERALRELDGFDWGGSILRVGWSKAVPVAAKPQYVFDANKSRNWSRSRSRSRSHSKERRHSRTPPYRKPSRSPQRARSRSPIRRSRRSYSRSRHSRSPRRRSRSPLGYKEEEEMVTDTFIRAVAAEIKSHDTGYEKELLGYEHNNPKFAFITNRKHRRHAFYRGLVESEQPLQPEFDEEESITRIGYNSVYSTDSAEDSEREKVRKTRLGNLARRRFESMLRALSGKRGEIARCMAFSLEHAEAAHEVADIIVASLLVDGTPVPRKVARLHLICDILHNSATSVPGAWKFRLEFQSKLGIVFDHLATIYHSFPGRITADTFKKQITAIVDIWENLIVFPPDFTAELRSRLDGSAKEVEEAKRNATPDAEMKSEAHISRFKSSTFKLATPAANAAAGKLDDDEPMEMGSDIDGEPADDIDGEPVDDRDDVEDDVDGEPVPGGSSEKLPYLDVSGIPVDEDLDGVPIDEDVDGAPIEDDVDGVPMVE